MILYHFTCHEHLSSDPPVLREQKTFDGRPQMVLAKDPTAPTGWRPARKAEIASGVYEEAAP